MSQGYEYIDTRLASEARSSERATFIQRTYMHLAGAILAFAGLETLILSFVDPRTIFSMIPAGAMGAVLMMGLFMGAAFVAQRWAYTATSPGMQYAGLGLYVLAEVVIFLPLLSFAEIRAPGAIKSAGVITLALFGGLTTIAMTTKADFSFMRSILMIGGWVAFGLIIAAMLFQFTLGLWFAFAMVALASGFILYDTSNVIHNFRTDQHVAAALELFASIALLFWYVLRIVIAFGGRD